MTGQLYSPVDQAPVPMDGQPRCVNGHHGVPYTVAKAGEIHVGCTFGSATPTTPTAPRTHRDGDTSWSGNGS